MNGDPTKQNPQTGQNRTWPDVVSEIVQALGKAAPTAIIVGGLLFAFYAFYALVAGTKQEQLDAAQKEVAAARTHLLDTFATLDSFTRGQLESLRNLIQLREEAETRAREAEQRVREAKDFIAEKERIEGQLRQVGDHFVSVKRELNDRTRELAKTESEFQAKLQQRAKRIETLNMDLQTGAATKQIPASSLLSDYASNPDEASANALQDLVGVSAIELVNAIHDDLGYAFWLTMLEIGNESKSYLGVVNQGGSTYGATVLIQAEEVVVDVSDMVDEVLVFRYPQVANWNYFNTSLLVRENESNVEAISAELVGTTWSVTEHLLSGSDYSSVKLEFGTEERLPVLSVSDLQSNFPDWFESVLGVQDSDEALGIEMALRAMSFDPTNVFVPPTVPNKLKKTLLMILAAAVTRQGAEVDESVGAFVSLDTFGKIAAAALQEHFLITTYDTTSGEIVAEYGPNEAAPQWELASFWFEKSRGNWRLTAFTTERDRRYDANW